MANLVYGQDFKGHLSGSFGVLNPKIRIQYEKPLQAKASWGANFNYYFVNWKGPMIEPFARVYLKGKDTGMKEGFFGQGKLIYGNLSNVDFDQYSDILANKRWSTYGVGVSMGYKFLVGEHFTIESLFGFRYTTPPVYRYVNDDFEAQWATVVESTAWYLTTGLPLDMQVKFGYQF